MGNPQLNTLSLESSGLTNLNAVPYQGFTGAARGTVRPLCLEMENPHLTKGGGLIQKNECFAPKAFDPNMKGQRT